VPESARQEKDNLAMMTRNTDSKFSFRAQAITSPALGQQQYKIKKFIDEIY
jgi:hypothetical protein